MQGMNLLRRAILTGGLAIAIALSGCVDVIHDGGAPAGFYDSSGYYTSARYYTGSGYYVGSRYYKGSGYHDS